MRARHTARMEVPRIGLVSSEHAVHGRYAAPLSLAELRGVTGIDPRRDGWQDDLPFGCGDVTAGTENELSTAVLGGPADVDFSETLRGLGGAFPRSPSIASWLGAHGGLWHHSWLRISLCLLHPRTLARLDAEISPRADRRRYFVRDRHGDRARLPASYVLRLALLDAMDDAILARLPALGTATEHAMRCFFGDNTAPEIVSTYIAADTTERTIGAEVARENALRFLLIQAVAAWSNARFGLHRTGQHLEIHAAPNPPERLRDFAQAVPAEVYRRLLLNPCLSGFEDGEGKAVYMRRCHETVSRSRHAAAAALRRIGVGLPRPVVPMVCDTSLLNNGVHVSLGSDRLTGFARETSAGAIAEKWYGDLVSKCFEHFLPLFVGTYSAAPLHVPVSPLRPEQTLGFLPLEVDAIQLRQTWAAWRRKAGLLAPLRGDVVPDARLLDYFVALPSTDTHDAHDGRLGNQARLVAELKSHGIHDQALSFYDIYKLREAARMGFSGFEARFYSAFPSFLGDMGPAVDLQRTVTLAAWSAIAQGAIGHADLPDDPRSQSERRQLMFHAAIGLPFFYVHRATANRFLLDLVAGTRGVRASKRYPMHLKVGLVEYGEALCRWLRADRAAAGLPGVDALLGDAAQRLRGDGAASARLTAARWQRGEPAQINEAIEAHHRGAQRGDQIAEAFAVARATFAERDEDPAWLGMVRTVVGGASIETVLEAARDAIEGATGDGEALRPLIALLVLHAESRNRGRRP